MSEVFHNPWLSAAFGDAEVSSYLTPEVQLLNMLRIEVAHCRILGNENAAKAIENAKLKLSDLALVTAPDGVPIPELIRLLKAQSDQALHCDIHRGLNSQDVIDTALVLSLKAILPIFEARIKEVLNALKLLNVPQGRNPLLGLYLWKII